MYILQFKFPYSMISLLLNIHIFSSSTTFWHVKVSLKKYILSIYQPNPSPPLPQPPCRSPQHDGLLRHRCTRFTNLLHLQTLSRRHRCPRLASLPLLNHPRRSRLGRSSSLSYSPPLPLLDLRHLYNLYTLQPTPLHLRPRYRPPKLQIPDPSRIRRCGKAYQLRHEDQGVFERDVWWSNRERETNVQRRSWCAF